MGKKQMKKENVEEENVIVSIGDIWQFSSMNFDMHPCAQTLEETLKSLYSGGIRKNTSRDEHTAIALKHYALALIEAKHPHAKKISTKMKQIFGRDYKIEM